MFRKGYELLMKKISKRNQLRTMQKVSIYSKYSISTGAIDNRINGRQSTMTFSPNAMPTS